MDEFVARHPLALVEESGTTPLAGGSDEIVGCEPVGPVDIEVPVNQGRAFASGHEDLDFEVRGKTRTEGLRFLVDEPVPDVERLVGQPGLSDPRILRVQHEC